MERKSKYFLTMIREYLILTQDSEKDFQFMDSPKFVDSLGFTSFAESTTEIGLFLFTAYLNEMV
jgi:hypothetical protein